jgi:hypothetical protein
MVVHGHILLDYYNQTPALWRPMADMQSMFGACLLFKFAIGAVLTLLFTRNFEGKGLEEGVRFGVYVGLLMGVIGAMNYLWLPISTTLAIAWFVDGIVYSICCGVILSWLYKK